MLAAVSQMPEFKRSSTSSSSSSSSQGTSPPSSSSCLRSVDQIQEQQQHQHQHQQQQLRSSTAPDDLVVDVMTTPSNAAAAARSWLPLNQQYPSTGYYYSSFHHHQQQQHEFYHCPFTASQWAELEHQALIFKYMMARAPVPAELLNPIRRSLLSAAAAAVNGPHNLLAGGFQPGLGFSPLDLEPGRCRRTDGKKWRCSRPVVPEQKYCERHVNRGRNRSKKAKEAAAAAAAAVNRASQSNGTSCINNGSSNHGSMKLISQHQMTFNNNNEHQTTRYLDHGRTVQTQHFTQQRIQDTGGGGLTVGCIAEADDESSAQLLLRRRAGAGGGSGVVRATQALAA